MRLWVRKYGMPTASTTIASPITRLPHAKPMNHTPEKYSSKGVFTSRPSKD